MHETRSEDPAQLTIAGLEGGPGNNHARVGGRQRDSSPRRRGGRYLNECIPSDLWELAKLRELEVMGMPGVWLEVARTIGYEPFMAMWKILDRSVAMRSESESMIEVQLRRIASYHRFQRNRFIESLAATGMADRQIQAALERQLGEKLSLSHISRLAAPRRVRAS